MLRANKLSFKLRFAAYNSQSNITLYRRPTPARRDWTWAGPTVL